MDIIRIESEGSFWFIDEVLMRYQRMPKYEAPRENPEWGGPEAGVLQDAVWLPYHSWRYQPDAVYVPTLTMLMHGPTGNNDIDFERRETGRWILVILSGPNPDDTCVVAPMPVGWTPPTT